MNPRAVARRPLDPDADIEIPVASPKAAGEVVAFSRPLTVLVLAPTLHAGAADAGAVDLVRILRGAGHRVLVASNGGRLEDEIADAGAEFIRLDVADFNPVFIARAAFALTRIGRIQVVVATSFLLVDRRSSSSASAGVLHSSVLRGLVLRAAATAATSSALCTLRSVPFGKY